MGHGTVEVTIDQHLDVVVKGCREQQTLAGGRRLVQQALDAGQKAHVGHVVRLVENGHFDSAETAMSLLNQVFEATWAGHNNVNTILEGVDLSAEAHASVNGGLLEPHGRSKRCDCCGNLVRQLAGWNQNQGPRESRTPIFGRCGQAGNDRNREGDGLAAAGLAATQQVSTSERIDQRDFLNGKWTGDAGSGQCLNDWRRYAEGRERTRRLRI